MKAECAGREMKTSDQESNSSSDRSVGSTFHTATTDA